jgi:hypothetical protein
MSRTMGLSLSRFLEGDAVAERAKELTGVR